MSPLFTRLEGLMIASVIIRWCHSKISHSWLDCNGARLEFHPPSLVYFKYRQTNVDELEKKLMILHLGERVYWGAPEVIYLEGTITRLDEQNQSVLVHIDRATPNSAHLIGSDVPFSADGVTPLKDDTPAGVTSERDMRRRPVQPMSDDENIRGAAAPAVYQNYVNTLSTHHKQIMIHPT